MAERGSGSQRRSRSETTAETPGMARPWAVATAQTSRESLKLDRLIHERMRLGIVSALAVNDSLTFNDLKELLRTTDGNLSAHARKLENAGYIDCAKSFKGRMPRSDYRLTEPGRLALERYLGHMEAIINATRGTS